MLNDELSSIKQSSIHGICVYGEINEIANKINICFSSNYFTEICEMFIKYFDIIMKNIIVNGDDDFIIDANVI